MLETTNFQANKPYIFFSMNLEGYLRESCQKKCNMLRAQFLKVTDSKVSFLASQKPIKGSSILNFYNIFKCLNRLINSF
jgi:hypothetical protein